MPYKISKQNRDSRLNTCGFFIPDGCYRVEEMNFENADRLEHIKRFGYLVTESPEAPGLYAENTGKRLDEDSARKWAMQMGELLDEEGNVVPPDEWPGQQIAQVSLEERKKELKARRAHAADDMRKRIQQRLDKLGVPYGEDDDIEVLQELLNKAIAEAS